MKRRKFLQVAGVTSAGLAAGCGSGEPDRWMPYLVPAEEQVPGIPTWYASTCRECPAGCGILVKTREGRPVKIEGNPRHPVNRGKLCARGQAALQGLYDPDRVTQPMKRDGEHWTPITWDEAEQTLATALTAASTAGADRVAYVGGADSGALDRFTAAWLAAFRSTRYVRYEAFAYEPLREANRLVFGAATVPHYDFRAARYILSFGADFLETWLSPVEYAAAFADAHGYQGGHMARFVAVEPRRGMTGFSADEWVAPKPGTEHLLALGIANAIVRGGRMRVSGGDADALRGFLARFDSKSVSESTGVAEPVIERLAREFAEAQPSLAVAGGVGTQHRAATQTAVAANILNVVAGNVGTTVHFAATSPWDQVARYGDVKTLLAAMNAGSVDVALVHGSNPAFTLPAGAGFGAAFGKVKLKVALASSLDETASLCDLVLPAHTALESWGALQPVAGTLSMVQPSVRPIQHQAKQAADVLLSVAQKAGQRVGTAASARELATAGVANLEVALQHGGTFEAPAPRPVRMVRDFARLDYRPATFDGAAEGLVLMTVPSSTLYDGRGANKAVLQEIPDPTTKITWQTWVELHPETSWRLGIFTGDEVEVAAGDRKVRALVYVYPGVHPDVVAMPIGRGHTAYGRYASGGANPLALLGDVSDASGALAFCQTRVTLTKTGERRPLATTEGSARQMGRGIARSVALAEAGQPPEQHEELTEAERNAIGAAAASQGQRRDVGVYAKPHAKWEMVIDLARCTGCSACVAACYQENNLATVGPDQVVRSREMAWIRLERYFEGDTAGTDWQVAQVPMLCQQCANAPCEPVCPVYAAYHTPDGLNGQIYNRCVGTRYCANNCPYKVRYFNWWDYGAPDSAHFAWPGTLELGLNPDVTVRTKGVMEKCTFCVQRIRFAQNDARVRGYDSVGDGTFTTACAQTCPADAITFGDAHDATSRVSHAKQDPRAYRVFEPLNTEPGITYLSRVIAGGAPAAGGEGH
jgi:anaerobic selenocysteine-containing dehydrogenase/Fe-S-cluster-containing dehydrogenase component